MNTTLNRLAIGAVLCLGFLFNEMASAETVVGKIAFLGTIEEQNDFGFHARFRMRVVQSTCETDNARKDRWIHVRSGRMDGEFAHNAANLRNAYSTLMMAFVTGRNVQIGGVPSCDASGTQTIDLWGSNIAIF